ncbi:hypothetical protein PVAND_001373 [Polypedilum vanderplanki]|uniref:Fibronectin type-III domain-containing protein n=1 Tax=Polypedilum vanderplanki TaxID=319348 RepID=A0A9J6BN69_POLVA|nr:hypothetical protein PVAND_001373 [Polypedilum vanderplanki]
MQLKIHRFLFLLLLILSIQEIKSEEVPKISLRLFTPRAILSTAINVTWFTHGNQEEILGFKCKFWKRNQNEEEAVNVISLNKFQNWILLDGLEIDTYYWVKCRAFNSFGQGDETSRFLEKTFKKAPQKQPTELKVTKVDSSTIKVTFHYDSPSYTKFEEPLEGFKSRIWEKDQNIETAVDKIIPFGEKLEFIFDNLISGKTYQLAVLALSNGGDGVSSPPITFEIDQITSNEEFQLNNSEQIS